MGIWAWDKAILLRSDTQGGLRFGWPLSGVGSPAFDSSSGSRGFGFPSGKAIALLVIGGLSSGSKYPLTKPRTTIGQAGAGADVEIHDPRVSALHCVVGVTDGMVRLYDLDSANGTYVGDERIQVANLSDCSEFRIGSTVFLVTMVSKQEDKKAEPSGSFMERKQRLYTRYAFSASASIIDSSGAEIPAQVTTIGAGGCRLVTNARFPIGERVNVRIQKGEDCFESPAQVAHCAEDGMGVMFHNESTQSLLILVKWLQQATADRCLELSLAAQ